MKIVDRAVKKVYRFNCPNCQSRLEGESKEFEDIGGKISKFFCPVCKKDRYITWSDLRKKTVYEVLKDETLKMRRSPNKGSFLFILG